MSTAVVESMTVEEFLALPEDDRALVRLAEDIDALERRVREQ